MKERLQIEHGKLPPQAVDVEEVVLGALLIESDALNEVIDILKPNSFYREVNGIIYQSIINLSNKSIAVDMKTVCNELKFMGKLEVVGGVYAVSQLTNSVASAANIEFHARIIEQKYIQREIIRHSSELITDGYIDTTDPLELADRFLNKAYEVNNFNSVGVFKTNTQLLREVTKNIELSKDKKGITGIQSGIHSVDELTGGYQNSNLIIKAGRPAMGKTAHAICEASFMAFTLNKKVVFFSLEMSATELMQRIVSIATDFPINKLKAGDISESEWKTYHQKTTVLTSDNLIIYDKVFTLNGIKTECRKTALKKGCDIIFIDYLQLIEATEKGQNREQEVSKISRALKLLAKTMNVPIICLSQLSRAVETRGGAHKPQLSDLRDSGSIEQDADMVQFLYRPEYYNISEDENGNSTNGLAYLIIAKHRSGGLKDIPMKFLANQTKFSNLQDETFEVNNNSMPQNNDFDNEFKQVFKDKF